MELEEGREADLRDLVARLDRLIPREGAHLTLPGNPGSRTAVGSRLGYLRFGVEFLLAAARPLPSSEEVPARIEPDLGYLLTREGGTPFDLCEIDEAIGSRPPVQTRLGALGQILAGLLVVAGAILLFIGAWALFRRLFGY